MTNSKIDQSFDDIAIKFDKNIYGSSKGQLRHELLLHHMHQAMPLQNAPLEVLDAGGGTGFMSQAMLELGHKVTLTDISKEALLLAEQRLSSQDQYQCLHTDILSLDDSTGYDVVICHAVLEWLQNPQQVLEKLARLVKPQGYLSLSFFNKDAQLFGNMCYGNFDYVEQGMPAKNIVRLSPNHPLQPKEVLDWLAALPLVIKQQAGIRCFHDYLKQNAQQISHYQQLKQLEIQYGRQQPYMWLGKYFHIISQAN